MSRRLRKMKQYPTVDTHLLSRLRGNLQKLSLARATNHRDRSVNFWNLVNEAITARTVVQFNVVKVVNVHGDHARVRSDLRDSRFLSVPPHFERCVRRNPYRVCDIILSRHGPCCCDNSRIFERTWRHYCITTKISCLFLANFRDSTLYKDCSAVELFFALCRTTQYFHIQYLIFLITNRRSSQWNNSESRFSSLATLSDDSASLISIFFSFCGFFPSTTVIYCLGNLGFENKFCPRR